LQPSDFSRFFKDWREQSSTVLMLRDDAQRSLLLCHSHAKTEYAVSIVAGSSLLDALL